MLFRWNVLLILSIFIIITMPAQAMEIKIVGKLIPPKGAHIPASGLSVVLLKFELNATGGLSTQGPLARIQSQANGHFEFVAVPYDANAAYRLGSRFEGELVSSDFFFMSSQQDNLIKMDLVIPGTSKNTELLEISQPSLFFEPDIGEIVVTEVLNISNPTSDKIDTRDKPFILNLPQGYLQFQLLGGNHSSQIQHYELLGNYLQFFHTFVPGNTQVAFQYRLSASFGHHEFLKTYRHPIQKIKVYTPQHPLKIQSSHLFFTGKQTFGESELLTWETRDLSSNQLNLSIEGVPIQQVLYLYIALGFFFILLSSVLIFIKFRLFASSTENHYQGNNGTL